MTPPSAREDRRPLLVRIDRATRGVGDPRRPRRRLLGPPDPPGEEYARQAEDNRLRSVPVTAPRGFILDRNGTVLAENEPAFTLLLYRKETKDLDRSLRFVADLLDRSFDELKRRAERDRSSYDFVPVVLEDNLTMAEVAAVEAHALEHPELAVQTAERRVYGHSGRWRPTFSATSGRPRSSSSRRARATRPGEAIGQKVERPTRISSRASRVPDVRHRLVRAGGGRVGARRPAPRQHALAHDRPPASRRSPRSISRTRSEAPSRSTRKRARSSRSSPRRRSTRTSSPSGSRGRSGTRSSRTRTTHSTTASSRTSTHPAPSGRRSSRAILANGIRPEERVLCTGGATFYGRFFRCHGRHGSVDLVTALQVSCDTYFYTMGGGSASRRSPRRKNSSASATRPASTSSARRAASSPLPSGASRRASTPGTPGRRSPSRSGRDRPRHGPPDRPRLRGIANKDGALPTPHLFHIGENVRTRERFVYRPPSRSPCRGAGNTRARRRGLWRVVNRPADRPFASPASTSAARRGPCRSSARRKPGGHLLPEALRDHGWFASFAPKDDPKIVVVVFVEHGLHGAQAAAPLAAKMASAWLSRGTGQPSAILARARGGPR